MHLFRDSTAQRSLPSRNVAQGELISSRGLQTRKARVGQTASAFFEGGFLWRRLRKEIEAGRSPPDRTSHYLGTKPVTQGRDSSGERESPW